MTRAQPSDEATRDPKPLPGADRWDSYWKHGPALPVEADRDGQLSTAILDVIHRFVASDSPLSVLEVGGAPSGYAAHLYRTFGHENLRA